MQKLYQMLNKQHYKTTSSEDNVKFILYRGSSMNSTLQDMDVLYYVPHERARPGDVVVIKMSECEDKVIHRIISIGKHGIRTMGDFNPHPDKWLLKSDQILGCVAYGYRGRKQFRVCGGLMGLAQMSYVRSKHFINETGYFISRLIPPGSSFKVKMPFIKPQKVAFKRSNGTELHLIALGKVVARRLPDQNWQIKFPFKYLLDEKILSD